MSEQKNKHYPSQRNRFSDNVKSLHINGVFDKRTPFEFTPLVEIKDENIKEQIQKLADSWYNNTANLNANNSLMQHSEFLLNRMGYAELTRLSTDDIIANAIDTIARECVSQWGVVKIEIKDNSELASEIFDYVDKRFKELDLQQLTSDLIKTTLIYGGALCYFAYKGEQDLEKELIQTYETRENTLLDLRIIEPAFCSPAEIEMSNPTARNYMIPSKWFITGGGIVDSSRLHTMIFFKTPRLISPMFNFLGLSIIHFMREKVRAAESMRLSLADIFLRFKTDIIRTPALKQMDSATLKQRVELINKGKNNFSTLLLTDDEVFEQSITPTAGLDKLVAQGLEAIAASARIPINKLFGQTPTGLNNSGAYDLENFYDTIRGYQASVVKPFLMRVIKTLTKEYCLLNNVEFALVDFDFEFNALKKNTELDRANIKNVEIEALRKLFESGILSGDDFLRELKRGGYISDDISELDSENDDLDIDLSELDLGENIQASQPLDLSNLKV